MDCRCQQQWMHGLPVRKRVREPRLNLTFRVFRQADEAAGSRAAR